MANNTKYFPVMIQTSSSTAINPSHISSITRVFTHYNGSDIESRKRTENCNHMRYKIVLSNGNSYNINQHTGLYSEPNPYFAAFDNFYVNMHVNI